MMIAVTTLLQLVAIISATVPHAEIRHFRDPVASGSATQESLHKATEEAAKRVHQAAAAARKAAHGDHSDDFANYLEQSMMKLEEEDKAIHEKAKERIAQHELDHKVQLQIKHAHEVAHERAKHMTPEQAYQQFEETAERIRKRAHADGSAGGDGSDSFANELEQSITALEEEKHLNDFKAHERHIQHEREHEMREELLLSQKEVHSKENEAIKAAPGKHHKERAADVHEVAHINRSDSEKWDKELEETILDLEAEKHDVEEKARLRRARHKLENEVDEELLHAMQPKKTNKFMAQNNHIVQQPIYDVNSSNRIPGLEDGTSNEEIVQSAQGVAVFLLISVIVFAILSWQKFVSSKDHCVVVPGLGRVNMVESERMMMGFINGIAPNAGLSVYGDDSRAAVRLKSAFGASASSPQGYGIFTL